MILTGATDEYSYLSQTLDGMESGGPSTNDDYAFPNSSSTD